MPGGENVSDHHKGKLLTLPVKRVFALQIREHDNTLLVRVLAVGDDEEVPETHMPPLPDVIEMNAAPYRRLSSDPANTY